MRNIGIAALSSSAAYAGVPIRAIGIKRPAALKRHGITYPVAQDNDSQTWNAYGNPVLALHRHRRSERKIVFHHDAKASYDQMTAPSRAADADS